MRRLLVVLGAAPFLLLALCCEDRGPLAPGSSTALDQFLQALRQQGFSVSRDGEIPASVMGFFSVPAQLVRVNDALVHAFAYPTAAAAAAEAALISKDGQPSPLVSVFWNSTPHFYRQGSLVVLYTGCSAEIIQALQATVGAPIAVDSRRPCEIAR